MVMCMKVDKKILNLLLKNAKKAFNNGEIPVSAIIVDHNGNIVSSSCNNRQKKSNVLGHAEINCILSAEKKLKDWRLDGCCMFVTLEPCDMCSMIINESRISSVYYFVSKKSVVNDYNIDINKYLVEEYPEYTDLYKSLLTSFFDNKR